MHMLRIDSFCQRRRFASSCANDINGKELSK